MVSMGHGECIGLMYNVILSLTNDATGHASLGISCTLHIHPVSELSFTLLLVIRTRFIQPARDHRPDQSATETPCTTMPSGPSPSNDAREWPCPTQRLFACAPHTSRKRELHRTRLANYPREPPLRVSIFIMPLCGFVGLAEHLIAAHSPDVNSRGGSHMTAPSTLYQSSGFKFTFDASPGSSTEASAPSTPSATATSHSEVETLTQGGKHMK